MDKAEVNEESIRTIRHVRQIRQYLPRPVPEELLNELLEIARWTGSSRNGQPWHFIVITDKEQLARIGALRDRINWVSEVPMAIAIVLHGESAISDAFDEGRVTERLLIAAKSLGLGGGTAWFGEESHQAEAKAFLGIPAEMTARSVITIGYPLTAKDHRANPTPGGRKPLSEIVSYDRYGQAVSK
jgi:nitroreductase